MSSYYDSVPTAERSIGFHAKCAEGRCITSAMVTGRNIEGATIATFDIKKGVLKPACPSCQGMIKALAKSLKAL